MEVEGEGGVVVAKVDENEDVVFFLKKTFDESEGVAEGGRVEKGGGHCERGWFRRKLVGLVASVRRFV